MLKIVRKHPILCGCAVIAVVSLVVLLFFATKSPLAIFALLPFAAACFVAEVIMNYRVFGSGSNSTIYRPGAGPDDNPR